MMRRDDIRAYLIEHSEDGHALETFQATGTRFGVSREAIRQIAATIGIVPPKLLPEPLCVDCGAVVSRRRVQRGQPCQIAAIRDPAVDVVCRICGQPFLLAGWRLNAWRMNHQRGTSRQEQPQCQACFTEKKGAGEAVPIVCATCGKDFAGELDGNNLYAMRYNVRHRPERQHFCSGCWPAHHREQMARMLARRWA